MTLSGLYSPWLGTTKMDEHCHHCTRNFLSYSSPHGQASDKSTVSLSDSHQTIGAPAMPWARKQPTAPEMVWPRIRRAQSIARTTDLIPVWQSSVSASSISTFLADINCSLRARVNGLRWGITCHAGDTQRHLFRNACCHFDNRLQAGQKEEMHFHLHQNY